jgi:hypothetical protein
MCRKFFRGNNWREVGLGLRAEGQSQWVKGWGAAVPLGTDSFGQVICSVQTQMDYGAQWGPEPESVGAGHSHRACGIS